MLRVVALFSWLDVDEIIINWLKQNKTKSFGTDQGSLSLTWLNLNLSIDN